MKFVLFKKVLLPILLLCLPSFSLADAALEQKIRAFILNNPEVIVDSHNAINSNKPP